MTVDFARLLSSPLEHLRRVGVAELILAGIIAALIFLGVRGAAPLSRDDSEGAKKLPRVEAPPLLLRDLAPQDALSLNRRIPFARGPNPAAKPFKASGDATSYARALECLTMAIYYEAANEPAQGQQAVAQVVLNRVRHPAFVPSVCGVVFHGSTRATGCQFSFTCDGSLYRRPVDAIWLNARQIAAQALGGAVFKPVGYATHYHADYVVPYWATSLAKNAIVGRHIFYRWPQWWGTPGAFRIRHAQSEPDPRLLRDLALRRAHVRQASLIASELSLETDPRVELMGIIQFLAAGSPLTEESSPYEEAVLLHFSRQSEHLAVQIYRQLSEDGDVTPETLLEVVLRASEPPRQKRDRKADAELAKRLGGRDKLQGFIAALRDFVKHGEFETFYGEQKSFYATLAKDARKPAVEMLVELEREGDVPIYAHKLTLAPLLAEPTLSACRAIPDKEPQAWLIVGVRNGPNAPLVEDKPFKSALAKLSESQCAKTQGSPLLAAR
jgi:hypothetical protein